MAFQMPRDPAALYAQWLRWLEAWEGDFAFAALRDTPFYLGASGPLEVYYGPFDHLSAQARLVLVGITPGRHETALAYRTARDGLARGLSPAAIARRVKAAASFGGPTRAHLTAMLDGIGVPAALGLPGAAAGLGVPDGIGLPSTAALFTPSDADLLHATAAVRYPVQHRGQDYAGASPPLARHAGLLEFVEAYLTPELALLDRALVVPLGKSVEDVLRLLVARGALDPGRCLFGFPHPSGRNVARAAQYAARQPALRRAVAAWHDAYG
jgi:hypothetical protein